MKNIFCILLQICALFTLSAYDQNATKTVLEKRADDVVKIINQPENLENFFSGGFLNQVPPDKFAEVSRSLMAQYGKALRVIKLTAQGDQAAVIEIAFERGEVATMNLFVGSAAPYLIEGLQITAVGKPSASLEEIVAGLKKLSGETVFAAVKLNGKDFTPIIAHNADKQLAIGSTFKLYVLAELVRSIRAGERKWSDVVELTEKSLPSGQLQNWAKGAPVTLHTLAAMMISISDNTATDQLIETLGREKIERMLNVAGNSNPQKSIPFLKTLELFKIKGATKQNYAQNYSAADQNARRQMLGKEIAAFKAEEIDLNFLTKPAYITNIEWFASPNDLARVMNYLKTNTEGATADPARGVLTINDALPEADAKNWNYVGYKGGSETGVISMTYLLESKKGEWFVVTGSWNDERAAVANDNFALLMQTAVRVLQEKVK